MKVGFSTPNAAGTGPVAQSAILTPATSVNGNAVNGSVLLSSGVPTLPQTAAPTAGPTPPAGSTSSGGLTPMALVSTSASGSGSSFVPLADAPATAMKVPDSGLGKTAVQSAASALLAGKNTVLAALLALKGAQPMSSTRPSVGNAVNGSVLLSSGVPTLPQTAAPTAGPTPPAGSTSSGGLTTMAPVSTSASGSGSSFVPLADAPATAMKVPDSGLDKTAVQSAASALLAGKNTVLAALLALKGAQPMSSTRPSVGGAGFVPAATLPSGLLLLLKDTVMPSVLTQTTQRSGEVRHSIPSPVLQSPPSLTQQLLNVPSALKSTLPNPLGPQSEVKTPENLAARASASPYAFQYGKATFGEMPAQHYQASVDLKADSVIVSARYTSNMIPMEANLRPTAAMLGPDRQADSPVGSKAALSYSARLSRQSEQIRTQTLQASSISNTRYQGQQSSASSVLPEVSARPSTVNPSKEALEYKPSLHSVMQSKSGGTMLSPEGLNMMARPNTVYVEGAAAGVRVEPEQARLLGLRAGETINAVVTQRQDGNVLLVGKQQLPLPERMNLPPGQVSLLVRVISGQPVLALTDPALAAQVAAAHQRTDSDGRFARLLNHIGSFHLSRVFSPGHLPALAAQAGGPEIQRGLASLLLDSRNLNSRTLRQRVQNMGLFGEHHASLNPGQTAPGLKSMMLALRALMQARQMETTSLSGAIDEIEARQIDSLAQQVAGRSHYSWVIPFSDQHPVFIELEHHNGTEAEGTEAQESWTVDLEVGLTETVSMAANVRVSHEGTLVLRLWLPEPTFYRLAEAGKAELEAMLGGQGLSLGGLTMYPVARDAGSVNYGQQRMGVSIDA